MEDWRVLLIGGNSGTGKTWVSQVLSGSLQASVIQVDDIRLALQAGTTEQSLPDVHRLGTEAGHSFDSPEALVSALAIVARALEPALRAVMSHHIDVAGSVRVVVEGDGLLPKLGSPEHLRIADPWYERVAQGVIRGVVLFEDDPQRIRMDMEERGRGFADEPERRSDAQVFGSLRWGEVLVQEAGEYGIPVVQSRPHQTLPERVAQAPGITP